LLSEISIRDFQSIAEADLVLGPLTVIVGPGNSGKTAAVRALVALALNRTGTDFIRRGSACSAVAVVTDDGHEISWLKEQTTARYFVDGTELTKLAGAVPDELTDALGIRRIEVEASSYAFPQVHSQFDAPFLLGESPGKAARVLAKLTRLEVIAEAQVAAARDLKRVAGSAKRNAERLETLEAQADEATEEANTWAKIAVRATSLHDDVIGLHARLVAAESAVVLLAAADAVLVQPIPAPQAFASATRLATQCVEGAKAVARFRDANAKLKSTITELGLIEEALVAPQATLAAIPICPLCGSPLKEEELLCQLA
jgi:hypothetical protein